MNRLARVLFSLGIISATALVCVAQTSTGQIGGTVKDVSGAVLPRAAITITNPATGASRTAQTNENGDFAVTLLPPGTYELKVEAQGFSTLVQKEIVLSVGQQLTLSLTLAPGAVTEIVTVTEEQPLIEHTRSEIYGAVSPLEVKELPIVDRNFAGLATLVPGVRPAQNFDPTKTRAGNMSLNGGDGRQFDVNVDGADNKDNVVGGLVQNFTVEGIQEFNVITNRYTAESGRTVGGIVNVVTKSGTNDFHGSVFGLFQISTFNRKSFFETRKPVFHRYHFGGSGGGPIIKDKLFVFGAYEHKREPGSISVLPDAFDELSLFPLADPVSQLPVPYKDHLLTLKVDHNISDRQNMSYRYGRQRWINPNDQLGNPFLTDLSQTNSDTNQFHDLTVQHNYAFASNKVNSFNAHFADFVNGILAAPQRTFDLPTADGGTATNPNIVFPVGAEIGQNVNIPQQTLIRKYQIRDDFSWTYGRHNMKFGANYIYLAKMGGFFFFGAAGYQVFFWNDPSVILDPANAAAYPDDFATAGAVREIDFSGGDGSFGQRPHLLGLYFQDDFKITPRLTLNLGLRWDANIDFLPSQLGSELIDTNRTVDVLRQVIAANPAAPEAQEGLARARALAGDDGDLRRSIASWKEFQPRIGFAWDPIGSGKHVIRGGYGIAFDQVFQNLTVFSIQQSHPGIYQTSLQLQALTGPLDPVGPTGPLATFRFGVDPLPTPALAGEELAVGGLGFIIDPKVEDPYAHQWSIGWAWEFHPDFAFSADYYHVLGIHEPRILQMNPRIRRLCDAGFPGSDPADPRCVAGANTRFLDAAFAAAGLGVGRISEIRSTSTTNRSRFDSFNFVLRKRLSHNFTTQASYVLSWSKSWGGRPTSSYSGTAFNITPENQFLPGEFGYTPFDERHRFVWSAHFQLPYGFEISPIFQAASARPFNFKTGDVDLDGDGRVTLDRVCDGSTISSFDTSNGCQQVEVNPFRGDAFYQMDVRFAKAFHFYGERLALRLYWEFYNLFDRDNFGNNFGEKVSAPSTFNQPTGYFGGPGAASDSAGRGFGPGVTGPLRSQFGFRLEW